MSQRWILARIFFKTKTVYSYFVLFTYIFCAQSYLLIYMYVEHIEAESYSKYL